MHPTDFDATSTPGSELTRDASIDTGSAAGPGPAAGRMEWADVAKGLCIALVVVHHIVSKHLPDVLPAGSALDIWETFDDHLKPLRMPLFFTLSGLFASRALRRPWGDVLGKKVVTPYWTYLAWLTIQVPVFAFLATQIATHRPQTLRDLVMLTVLAATGLWYLYGLAVYFVLAKLLIRVHPVAILAAAAVVSAAASSLPVEGVNRVSLLQCFVFFALGARAPHLVSRARRLDSWAVAAVLGGSLTVAWVCETAGAPYSVTGLLVAPFAIVLGIQAAMRLHANPLLGLTLANLGRRTLPVYVMHMLVLGCVHQAVTAVSGSGTAGPAGAAMFTGPAGQLVALLYPLLLAVATIAASLAVHRMLLHAGATWLFAPPSSVLALTRPRREPGLRST